MTIWPRSLQAQLVLRLTAVFLIAAAAGVGALLYESNQTADALRREELLQRAHELARFVARDTDGAVRVALPAGLDQVYRTSTTTDQFVIRSTTGQPLAASQPEFTASTRDWPTAGAEPRYVRLKHFGRSGQEYCALTVHAESQAGPISVTVARALDG